jgi:hypothetical protein
MSETEFCIFWNACSRMTTLTLLPTLRGKNNNCILSQQGSSLEMLRDVWRFGGSEIRYWLQNFVRITTTYNACCWEDMSSVLNFTDNNLILASLLYYGGGGGSKVDTVSGVIQMLICKIHKSRENQPQHSKRNKTVPGKVATTRTEDGHK